MLKDQIKNILEKALGEIGDVEIVVPEKEQFGHYFTNVALRLAKKTGKNPMEVAQKLTNNLQQTTNNFFSKIEVVQPGFINFWLTPEAIQNEFLEIFKSKSNWGRPSLKLRNGKKTIVIDYSHPNIAKPMSVAHLRSTIIGQALYNIFKFSGWKTIGDNHLGDWGTQFGIMIVAVKRYKTDLNSINIGVMLNIYVKFNKEIEQNPALRDEAKEEFKKLEQGDKENRKIWKILRDKSLNEFERIYKILGIKFDLILGESFYEKYLRDEINEALEKRVAIKNPDGSIIISLDKFDLIRIEIPL